MYQKREIVYQKRGICIKNEGFVLKTGDFAGAEEVARFARTIEGKNDEFLFYN